MSRVYIGPYLRFKVPVAVNKQKRRGCPTCKVQWATPFCPNHGIPTEEVEIESKSPIRTWHGFETKVLKCIAAEGDFLRDNEVFYLYGVDAEHKSKRDLWWQWTSINRCKSMDLSSVIQAEEMRWLNKQCSQEIKGLTKYFGIDPSYHWGLIEPVGAL